VNLSAPDYAAEVMVDEVDGGRLFGFGALGGYANGWFTRGRLRVLSGAAQGLVGQIKVDRPGGALRRIELWQELRAPVVAGDLVRVEAGCDKSLGMCRAKFGNVVNFRGYPHIPGDDWVTTYPQRTARNDGGSYVTAERDLT
jgi:uncharacterized phage protein (TIGR02218 family)